MSLFATGSTESAESRPLDNRALDSLRMLVAADGADFELVEFDDATATMRLRLVIPDARCAECVMPRSMLESIAVPNFLEAYK